MRWGQNSITPSYREQTGAWIRSVNTPGCPQREQRHKGIPFWMPKKTSDHWLWTAAGQSCDQCEVPGSGIKLDLCPHWDMAVSQNVKYKDFKRDTDSRTLPSVLRIFALPQICMNCNHTHSCWTPCYCHTFRKIQCGFTGWNHLALS